MTIDNEPDDAYSSRRHQFRRNQTLTGSTSTYLTSAAETMGTMQSPRATTHHLRKTQRSLGLRIVGLLVLAAMTMLFLYQFIAVVSVSYYGQITDSSDTTELARYQKGVQDYLAGRPLERIRLFLNVASLAEYLQAHDSSEVRQISAVHPAGLGKAELVIKMREPVVAWTIDGNKQYVDRDGFIFTKNHYTEPKVTVVDESGLSTGSNIKTIVSSRFLEFIGRGVGFASKEGLSISRVIIPADTTRQVQFSLNTKARTRLKLSIDRPVGEQIEDAVRANTYLTKKGIAPRYIDVRISGRAYYI
ncbi:MAG TPA: hypothetical protein VL362_01880 [Patescibacteria group bacterium]|jgi:hypothetical protein|nr:hypothetical protein [Patescibacteria group bacterium]